MGKVIYTYCITNLLNGKRYIGSHTAKSIHNCYYGGGLLVKRAIKKHGKKNFKKEILVIHEDRETAYRYEEIFIKGKCTLYPHGYNLSPTGGPHKPGWWSEGQKKNCAGYKFENGNIPWNVGKTKENDPILRRISREQKKRWEDPALRREASLKQAGEKGPAYGRRGRRSNSYGYVFSEELLDGMREHQKGNTNARGISWDVDSRKRVSFPVLQYDLNGNFIKEWPSAPIAAEALGGNRNSITGAAIGKNKTGCGFKWKYKNPPKTKNGNKIKDIVQCDLNDNAVANWTDVRSASEGTGISTGSIRNSLSGRTLVGGGYIWKKKE